MREALKRSNSKQNKFVALDVGPLGKLLKPLGDLDFEDAVEIFAATIKEGVAAGVDLITIETMNDSYETKACVLAAKENSSLPVIVTNAYGEDGHLMTGADPLSMVAMLEGLGVDAIGVNCSLGPKQLFGVVEELCKYSSLPVIVKPNAGLPSLKDGVTTFDVGSDEFSDDMVKMAELGAVIFGGCCGTESDHILKTVQKINALNIKPKLTYKNDTLISSYTHAVKFGGKPVLIGERINPTGKKRFKQALIEGDKDYILKEGLTQASKGANVLDVNVGLPELNESEVLVNTVSELQAVTDLPLQIDTSDFTAMEKALRIYNGKAMINSVNGKVECMKKVFPLVKKYGGVVVALTLDEDGIPSDPEKRIEIAKNIIKVAKEYGIEEKNLVFDTLCMAVSTNSQSALSTLKSLNYIRNVLHIHTVLGVSNISFGLPSRETVNSTFFALALENGLSSGIINPYSQEMMKVYYSFCLLHRLDEGCGEYINFIQTLPVPEKTVSSANPDTAASGASGAAGSASKTQITTLHDAVVSGLKALAATLCEKLLETVEPLQIVNEHIVPALDVIGKEYEAKKVYLPQLLMSAEAAQSAFEKIKNKIAEKGISGPKKCTVVVATVKGDVHDIGKNIVRTLLENYGFNTIDLGKDVDPALVVETVKKEYALVCGLSALMTTTVPAMKDTTELLHKECPWCKVVVGGAVLNQDYADMIGADKYAKDAMETVRYAETVDQGK